MNRKRGRTSTQDKIGTVGTRYMIVLPTADGERFFTNTGIWVRVPSLARRFLTKESADTMAGNLARVFGTMVRVIPERIED